MWQLCWRGCSRYLVALGVELAACSPARRHDPLVLTLPGQTQGSPVTHEINCF